jgi:thiol-disulfide isomerase/thioredoxin
MIAAAACTVEPEPDPAPAAQASPFADCAALTAPPSVAPADLPSVPADLPGAPGNLPSAPADPPSASGDLPSASGDLPSARADLPGARADLPDVELPCFTGAQPVRLADLRGPAVISLWASWCEPCREELPAMQRLADATAGRLTVLGVNTGDGRDAAASFGAAKNVTMPTLYDREQKLASALGRVLLPVTVFVDAAGKRHVEALPVDPPRLAELVRTHAGVTVSR